MGIAVKESVGIDTADFVLSSFNKQEQEKLPDLLNKTVKAISCFLKEGFSEASNQFNTKDRLLNFQFMYFKN